MTSDGDPVAPDVIEQGERAWRLIERAGWPAFFAMLFTAVFFGWITSPLTRTESKVDAHMSATAELQKDIQKLIQSLDTVSKGQILSYRMYCKSLARTPEDRLGCDQLQLN